MAQFNEFARTKKWETIMSQSREQVNPFSRLASTSTATGHASSNCSGLDGGDFEVVIMTGGGDDGDDACDVAQQQREQINPFARSSTTSGGSGGHRRSGRRDGGGGGGGGASGGSLRRSHNRAASLRDSASARTGPHRHSSTSGGESSGCDDRHNYSMWPNSRTALGAAQARGVQDVSATRGDDANDDDGRSGPPPAARRRPNRQFARRGSLRSSAGGDGSLGGGTAHPQVNPFSRSCTVGATNGVSGSSSFQRSGTSAKSDGHYRSSGRRRPMNSSIQRGSMNTGGSHTSGPFGSPRQSGVSARRSLRPSSLRQQQQQSALPMEDECSDLSDAVERIWGSPRPLGGGGVGGVGTGSVTPSELRESLDRKETAASFRRMQSSERREGANDDTGCAMQQQQLRMGPRNNNLQVVTSGHPLIVDGVPGNGGGVVVTQPYVDDLENCNIVNNMHSELDEMKNHGNDHRRDREREALKEKYCKVAIMACAVWSVAIAFLSVTLSMDLFTGSYRGHDGTLCTLCGGDDTTGDGAMLDLVATSELGALPPPTRVPSPFILDAPPDDLAEVCAPSILLRHSGPVDNRRESMGGCVDACMPSACCLVGDEGAREGLLAATLLGGGLPSSSGLQHDLSALEDCNGGANAWVCDAYREWCATLYEPETVLEGPLLTNLLFDACNLGDYNDETGTTSTKSTSPSLDCDALCRPLACCYDGSSNRDREHTYGGSGSAVLPWEELSERRLEGDDDDDNDECRHFDANDPVNSQICDAYDVFCGPTPSPTPYADESSEQEQGSGKVTQWSQQLNVETQAQESNGSSNRPVAPPSASPSTAAPSPSPTIDGLSSSPSQSPSTPGSTTPTILPASTLDIAAACSGAENAAKITFGDASARAGCISACERGLCCYSELLGYDSWMPSCYDENEDACLEYAPCLVLADEGGVLVVTVNDNAPAGNGNANVDTGPVEPPEQNATATNNTIDKNTTADSAANNNASIPVLSEQNVNGTISIGASNMTANITIATEDVAPPAAGEQTQPPAAPWYLANACSFESLALSGGQTCNELCQPGICCSDGGCWGQECEAYGPCRNIFFVWVPPNLDDVCKASNGTTSAECDAFCSSVSCCFSGQTNTDDNGTGVTTSTETPSSCYEYFGDTCDIYASYCIPSINATKVFDLHHDSTPSSTPTSDPRSS